MLSLFSIIIGVVGVVVGIVGVAIAVYFGRKSLRLEHKIRRFDWEDVEHGVRWLRNQLIDFRPDLLLSISGPGSIVSHLLVSRASIRVPVYTAVSRRLDETVPLCEPTCRHRVTTSKWEIYIPDDVFRFRDARILICDDCVLSGDTLSGIVDILTKQGFKKENIFTMALIATELAINSHKGPDSYWFKCADSEFYMPWGKSYGRGY